MTPARWDLVVFVAVAVSVALSSFGAMLGCTLILSRRCLDDFSWLYPTAILGGWGIDAPFSAAVAGGVFWASVVVFGRNVARRVTARRTQGSQ